MSYKQIIIARRDLEMSPGKLAAQVAHGSMAFLTHIIQNGTKNTAPVTGRHTQGKDVQEPSNKDFHLCVKINSEIYNDWINGEFTKCVLGAKNKNGLLKAKRLAEDLGLKEGTDFFLIRDNCHTELDPEENGSTLTVIGFRPMESEIIDKIGKRFQLY